MAGINLNNSTPNLQVFDNRSTLTKLQDVAQKAKRPQSFHADVAHYDGEFVLAKGAAEARTKVMDTEAGMSGGGEAIVNAKIDAAVEGSADLLNGDANLSAKAGAMVGTKVSQNASADVAGIGMDVTGEAWAGSGAEAEANATMDDWNINLELKAGIGLDVGGKLASTLGDLLGVETDAITGGAFGTRVNFDAKPLVDGATEVVDDAVENAEANVDAMKETAEDVIEAVEDAAEEVGEAAGEFVEDTSDAVSDFFSSWL